MNEIAIIPTNTCPPDLATLEKTTDALRVFAAEIQLDISDGIFSPVKSWPYNGQEQEIEKMTKGEFQLPRAENLAYEVHLMVQEAREIGVQLAKAGAHRILGHIESFSDETVAHEALDAWREAGAREAGLAVLMPTSLEVLEPVIGACDVVQLMTIPRIGSQGAPFADGAIERVAELHRRHPEITIAVDGAVSEENIQDLTRAGARRFGVGSAISKAKDPAASYAALKALAEQALV